LQKRGKKLWIYNVPEPIRTIVATLIAVIGFLLMFGSPLLILTLGTCAILDSDSNKDKKE